VSLLFQRQFVFHSIFFSCVLYYIKLHYITLCYYLVYTSLLSLLQLFFCLLVRLLYAINYYLLTYLLCKVFISPSPLQCLCCYSYKLTVGISMVNSIFNRLCYPRAGFNVPHRLAIFPRAIQMFNVSVYLAYLIDIYEPP